jgi:hypothetical protein
MSPQYLRGYFNACFTGVTPPTRRAGPRCTTRADLHDDDEYRAITRETIMRGLQPGQPRVNRALTCLLAEINQNPPVIPGDHRPITYQLADT